jgi:hypothetical protein
MDVLVRAFLQRIFIGVVQIRVHTIHLISNMVILGTLMHPLLTITIVLHLEEDLEELLVQAI